MALRSQTADTSADLSQAALLNFRHDTFISETHRIDSVSYNCVCYKMHFVIYAVADAHKKKNGPVLILRDNGVFYASGEFKANKKSGWWWYGGCCRTLYKRDKEKRTVCALF
ncbi:MAG: hypothetical protein JST26_19210 [Bacteroidetes bacterium]|nr:hypothetical protein [Bacteroidota bacterium]